MITEGMGTANTKETRYRGRDAYTLDNTVLKMGGKKRALVDAARGQRPCPGQLSGARVGER